MNTVCTLAAVAVVLALALVNPCDAACGSGQYGIPPDPTCHDCPAGTYKFNGTYCANCTAGSWSPVKSDACTNATLGHYAPNSTVELPCELGYYAPTTGLTACLIAPPGSFVNATGASEAYDCDPGSYQDTEGQTSCIPCDPGTFSSDIGAAAECAPCGAGTYCAEDACTGCFEPDDGFVVPVGHENEEPVECENGTYAYGAIICVCADMDHYASADHSQQIPCPSGYEQPLTCQTTCDEQTSCEHCGAIIGGIVGGLAAVGLVLFVVVNASKASTVADSVKYNRLSAL